MTPVQPTSGESMLSPREAAEILGVSTTTVRRLIARRALPAARIGGQVRIDADDLRRFIAASRLAPGGGLLRPHRVTEEPRAR